MIQVVKHSCLIVPSLLTPLTPNYSQTVTTQQPTEAPRHEQAPRPNRP